VFRYLMVCLLAWLLVSCALAEISPVLQEFALHAVPVGEIRYCGAFTALQSVYHVFTLRQAERRGVLLVRQAGPRFEVVGADTSLDSFPSEPTESRAIATAAARRLNGESDDPFSIRRVASVNDICPLGASLNTLLIPITGFALSSNGTLGILRNLQHADARVVDPEHAPPGSILVCPSHFAAQGPVLIGFAVVVGPDRCVYGPDYRLGGAWRRLATLSEWLSANQSVSDVRGFLLRAKANDHDQSLPHKPSPTQP
jgi:hypothetical protein